MVEQLTTRFAHLVRRTVEHAGLHLSVRELTDELAGIGEQSYRTTTAAKAAPARNACSPT